MNIRDSHNRKLSFDTKEELGDKIDTFVVIIGKLATRDSGTGRQFKPQIYQDRGRGKNELTMTDAIMISEAIRTDIGQIVKTEDIIDKIEVGLGMNKIIKEEISEETRGALTNRIAEESKEIITQMKVMIKVGTGLEKSCFPEAITTIEIEVQPIVGPGQDQEQVCIETK